MVPKALTKIDIAFGDNIFLGFYREKELGNNV